MLCMLNAGAKVCIGPYSGVTCSCTCDLCCAHALQARCACGCISSCTVRQLYIYWLYTKLGCMLLCIHAYAALHATMHVAVVAYMHRCIYLLHVSIYLLCCMHVCVSTYVYVCKLACAHVASWACSCTAYTHIYVACSDVADMWLHI